MHKDMTTRKAKELVTDLNPAIKHSKSFIRRLEVDEEDRSIKFINLFGAVMKRLYYTMETDTIDVAYEIFDYLSDRYYY